MKTRESLFFSFFFFFILSIVFLAVSQKTHVFSGLVSLLEQTVLYPREVVYAAFHNVPEEIAVKQENDIASVSADVSIGQLKKDNIALSDQFKTTYPASSDLLPATVVGAPEFIPNTSPPEQFIIDKGKKDNLVVGLAVIYKNNLVGKIAVVSEHLSVVDLLTKNSFSTPVKTDPAGALGVLRGQGKGTMILDNVLLSETLSKNDLVLTSGSMSQKEVGLPPDLIIGKIISIEKKSSNLFQSARVSSLLDFQKLSKVFVFVGYK